MYYTVFILVDILYCEQCVIYNLYCTRQLFYYVCNVYIIQLVYFVYYFIKLLFSNLKEITIGSRIFYKSLMKHKQKIYYNYKYQ